GVVEARPRVDRPVAELLVGEDAAREPDLGIDPEERPRGAEMAERPRRAPRAGPVRRLAVAQLEGEPPVVRLHAAEAREHPGETGKLDGGRLVERLRRDERRPEQLARELQQVVERARVAPRG